MSVKLQEARQKLKAKLKWGDQTRIAKNLGMHRQSVYLVLNGEWENDAVWKLVAEYAAQNDEADNAIIQAAESLSL